MPTICADPPAMDLMLRNLPAPQREILVATYFRGHTTNQAASQLGITPAEVRSLIYQAMLDLSEMVVTQR